jgi:transposase InsO family protein
VVNITKASATTFLKSIVCRFGVPNRIITDNGTPFTSQYFQEYYEDIGIQLCFTSVAHPRSNAQVERANLRSSEGSRSGPTVILKNMAQNGLTSFRAYCGGTRPHPAGRLGRPLSSWSTGLKHAFPRRSPWARYGSKLSMRTCRSSNVAKTWTSSTSENGEQQSETHGTTKHSGVIINGSCIVGSSGSGTWS